MIDEKKIEEAAYKYAGNGLSNAFIQGVEWFKKSLWHSIHEEPQKGKKIITKWWDVENDMCYEIDDTTYIPNWKNHCNENDIMAWCYLSDILI